MVRSLICLAAGLTIAVTPALAAGKAPVVTNPDWLSRPSGQDMGERYPPLATRLEISGYAEVSCSVDAQGGLEQCVAPVERPSGLGFGAAALALTPLFKMRPMTVDGKPVPGGTVRIPIHFALPPPSAVEPPPAPTGESLRHAQRLVDAVPYVDLTLKGIRQATESVVDPSVPAAARKAALDAVAAAADAHRADMRDAFARAFASVFSEGELQALADYAEGPGKALQNRPQLAALQGELAMAFKRALQGAAHDVFCAGHPCGAPADLARVWRAADPRDKRLDNPVWAGAPTAYAARQKAPLLEAIGLSGAVRLTCRIGKEGRLEACEVDEQAPRGLGLGEAALALTGAYALSPIQLADDGAGRKVTVRVGFAPAAPATVDKPPEPRSPRALELARRLIDPDELRRNSKRDIELQILKFQTPPKGAEAKTWDAALDAYRAGGETAVAAMIDLSARRWAAVYTEDELATQVAFHDTPAGRAQRERQPELNVALGKAAAFVAEKITADARDAFCAPRGCARIVEPGTPALDPKAKAR
jgi:TonB family protein